MFKKSNAGDQLLLAIKLNKVSEISRLVALGVNVNSRIDKNGKTALHYAAYKGLLASVKALIEAGADLDITDENGVTALHRAAIDGHADVAHALLDSGCSMDKKDENGNTPLHEAAWNGYSKCVTLLVNAKCNVNLHNRTGYTSLHLAAQNCHCKSLELLLKGGANPVAKNNYGDTSLHIAARYGHKDACKILLETPETNVSEQNNDGNTALHIAAGMRHEKIVEMLVKAGCSVTTRNNIGDTATDIAIQNGFKKTAKLLTPASGESWKFFRKGRKERPRSVEVSSMYVESLDSTQATTATQLWIPRPMSLDHDPKKLPPKREADSQFEGRGKKKGEGKLQYRVLTIKPNEMCSIEREYSAFLKKKQSTLRRSYKSDKSHSRSTLKSQDEMRRSDPGFYVESKSSHARHVRESKKKTLSAQSRDDLEIALAPKKNKKEKGLFAIFRSSSDPDLTSQMKNGTVVGKKHKEKFPNSKQLMGNGVHHRIPEEAFNEKGEIEETKENRRERKERERGEHRKEKRDKSSKKERDDKDKWEKKERKSEKEKGKGRDKEKKHSRRDEKEGSEADCSVCQEKLRKSREKSHSKESRHRDKEHVRSKSEHKRVKEYDNPDIKYSDQRSTDEDKEYKRKKHHYDREKEKDKPKKDKHHSKHHERHYDKHHKRRNEEVELRSIPCNPDHCSTCKASLSRLEAWQERCTAEIESARRRLEHRLQRLEKKLEHQRSDERQSRDKEIREKEYDRVVDRVTDECRAVNKNVKDSTGDVKEEIRGLIKGGLSKLELRLGQISTGYNIPFMDFKDRCNPELGRNCTASRRAVRSRSSPHLGRAPCADCASVVDQRMGVSPLNTPLSVSRSLTSGTDSLVSSRVSSHALASDTGSMETVIEARPVSEEEVVKVPETILEAQPVVEESVYNVKDTYAAAQVQHQRQIQEVEKWWRAKAEDEQRVLYARIWELEQMLMMTRVGSGGDSGCIV